MHLSSALPPPPGLTRMSSAVLKWIANGVISLVVVGTLWIAHAVQPGAVDPSAVLVAQAVAAPAQQGASAPLR
jgi:hypothetical protein